MECTLPGIAFSQDGRRGKRQNQRGFVLRQASSPSPSLLRKSTSPKGRGLGKEMKFAWTAKGSPFGRAGIEQSEMTERARVLPVEAHIQRKQTLLLPVFPNKKTSRAARRLPGFGRMIFSVVAYSSTSPLSKNARPNAPGPAWVPMTQPICRTSGSGRSRVSRK